MHPHTTTLQLAQVDLSRVLWRSALVLLLIMNLLDACFTLSWVCLGHAEEANPAMQVCLEQSPVLFMSVKLWLVMGGVWAVRKLRRHTLARVGVGLSFTAYGLVMITHVDHLLGSVAL